MNKFYLITNSGKDQGRSVTNQIKEYLEQCGKTCVIQEAAEDEAGGKYKYTNPDLIPYDVDCLIVLGGDGTLIQAARDTIELGIPLLGVNLGTLGFLAEIDRSNVIPALDKLIGNQYTVEKRMMLRGTIYREGKILLRDIALNDIVVGRNGHLRIIDLKISVNGEFLNAYSADGIIISTPTGSTGYNLSVGGPIIEPQAAMLLVTPIAPHTLNTRSIVLAAEDKVIVELGRGRRTDIESAEVTYDGDAYYEISTGDQLVVQKAVKDTKIIKISNISFLEILREKMSGN